MDLVAILRAEGLEVEDHRRAPAPGAFHPIGVLLHHTASSPQSARPAPSLGIVINGRPDVPGPLCQVLVGRDLRCRVITDGKANHAGKGSSDVLARLRAGLPPVGDARIVAPVSDMVGNEWLWGIEIENDGVGEEWAPELVRTGCRVAAAICRAERWTSDAVLLHREWTARKIDPNFADGPTWRQVVAEHLLAPLVVAPIQEERMYLVRNAGTGAIHVVAERTGLGARLANMDAVAELETKGVVDAPPAGVRWVDLSPEAFAALPGAALDG